MKRDIIITFVVFAVLILLVMGSVFEANAGHGNGNGDGQIKKRVSFSGAKIRQQRKRQNGDNANTNEVWDTSREFPMMFDIAARSQKAKEVKADKIKSKKGNVK